MSGSHRGESDTTWRVPEHDEAKYNFSDEKGVWQPKPEDILSLFEKLAQGNPLPLKWTCPGRRPPEKDVNSERNVEDDLDEDGNDSRKEELKTPETSAFDFDEPYVVNAKLIPKRAPGGVGRTPKTEKRVARMDNIMKSLHKQQLQRVAEREARKSKSSPAGTPNRPRLLNFGSDSPKTVGSSLASNAQAGSSASPRFGRGGTSFSSTPLLNRSSAFATPMSAARKITLQSGAGSAATELRVSEMTGLQTSSSTNSLSASSTSAGENRTGQLTTAAGQADTEMSLDDVSAASAQQKILSTSGSSTNTSSLGTSFVNNNSLGAGISTPVSSTNNNTFGTAGVPTSNNSINNTFNTSGMSTSISSTNNTYGTAGMSTSISYTNSTFGAAGMSTSVSSLNNASIGTNMPTSSSITSPAVSVTSAISSSSVSILDCNLPTAESIHVSLGARTTASIAASATSANPSGNMTSASETHPAHLAEASSMPVSQLGLSLETACFDMDVSDHFVNLTESVTLSDNQNCGSTN